MTDNHLKPWSAADVSELLRLKAGGASIEAIATVLGRSPGAIVDRLKVGQPSERSISLKPSPWNAKVD